MNKGQMADAKREGRMTAGGQGHDGSREVPFDPEMVCDVCGKLGAFDFMGDGICPECMRKGDNVEVGE